MVIVSILGLIMLVGLLMYALASNAKLVEIGRIMFFCALLAFCFALNAHVVAVLR